ncbi:hypothetical protein LZG04_15870 [Saccharothrix sp. S26]|uniref:hypothetical protein n=1 Tax=Saccharothrix sp. S26 TaxID=2907215 RepID=UPI001F1DEFC3|nr:hypothetical protein [Saccharothrix sp. S26]MCE6996263.1 hypothetical protein [Saccharothrix sp. S26]
MTKRIAEILPIAIAALLITMFTVAAEASAAVSMHASTVAHNATVNQQEPPCPWKAGCHPPDGELCPPGSSNAGNVGKQRRVTLENVKVAQGQWRLMWWDNCRDFKDNFCHNICFNYPEFAGSYCKKCLGGGPF